jgi:Ca2+-binding RTX toxin-like protein
MLGGADADTMFGGDGDDLLRGGEGDDLVAGNAGNDRLFGDDGNDLMFGDGGNDRLDGGLGDDDLRGGDGADVLVGGIGSDTLNGGAGLDVLTGGADSDMFLLWNSAADADRVTDFVSGVDRFLVEAGWFGGGLAAGNSLQEHQVVVNGQATVAGDGAFLFDSVTKALTWDADGAGGGAGIVVATLTGVNTLTVSDFEII